ncbi:hypothetical protein PC116_g34246 [Phytophthora cactorum]|nr:hypothetical protein PC116_g34246 [Phytophthora cactorum]
MDLESTLIRAEQLFRRFQRLIEAIDKKQNFPTPRTRQDSSSNSGSASPTQSRGNNGKGTENQPQKTITPELRKLLSKKIEVLPRKAAQKKSEKITTDGT